MLTIRFFPHATTLDNEAGISTGNVEVALSALGKEQITQLKDKISHEVFDAVFSSDLQRAVETAQGALGEKYEIKLDSRLREINIGDFTKELDSVTHPLAIHYIEQPFPHGESFRDVEKRIRDFLNEISNNYSGKTIAIFAHQAPQLALEVITKNISWEQALHDDWRNTHSFQYGWDYNYN